MTDSITSLEQPGLDEAQQRLRRTLESLTGIAFTEGNQLTVLRNGDRIFPAMLRAIEAAERSVDLMTYVYWKGEIATRFADTLSAAARRGVRVRLLIDAVGGLPDREGPGRPHGPGRRARRVVPQALAELAAQAEPPLPPEGARGGRADRFTGGVGIAEEWCGDARNEREWRTPTSRYAGRR